MADRDLAKTTEVALAELDRRRVAHGVRFHTELGEAEGATVALT